ncbi:hypothetical protein BH11PAT4_BH11PAT4_7800 [soil metagenome]
MPKDERRLVDFLGWYGMVAILVAYILLTYGYLTPQSAIWQVLNLTGSLGLAFNSVARKAMPEFWLNAIFALVAVTGLYQILRG